MRPRIDLHVGGDEDVVPDVDAVVVDERAVHVDHDVVADEDVAAEFAMKINVEMNALSHVSEEFAHQALFFFAVVVLDVVQLPHCSVRDALSFHGFGDFEAAHDGGAGENGKYRELSYAQAQYYTEKN